MNNIFSLTKNFLSNIHTGPTLILSGIVGKAISSFLQLPPGLRAITNCMKSASLAYYAANPPNPQTLVDDMLKGTQILRQKCSGEEPSPLLDLVSNVSLACSATGVLITLARVVATCMKSSEPVQKSKKNYGNNIAHNHQPASSLADLPRAPKPAAGNWQETSDQEQLENEWAARRSNVIKNRV